MADEPKTTAAARNTVVTTSPAKAAIKFVISKLPRRPVTKGAARALQHEDDLTVAVRTIGDTLKDVKFNRNQKVVYAVSTPISLGGGVVGLKGLLALEGAIVKVAGMKTLTSRGLARCFDCEADDSAAVAGTIDAGEVLLTPHRGLGHYGIRIGHVGQGAAPGSPIALLQDGHVITIDGIKGALDVKLSKAELAKRRKALRSPADTPYTTGALRQHVDQVGPAVSGAVVHAGGKAERVCDADI